MKTAWTPGPWKVRGNSFVEAPTPEGHPYFGRTKGTQVLEDDDYPTRMADLHLVASAPELYEALEAIASRIEETGANGYSQWLAMTKSLLARARSE